MTLDVMNEVAEPTFDHRPSILEAQKIWATRSVQERTRFLRPLRQLIAKDADDLGEAAAQVAGRPLAEKLVAEVLPLAEACKWLEKSATKILSSRLIGKKGRPLWLGNVSFEVQRQPHGLILIIGPGNYPLFLPAVQALHALVAGNAVLLKPAPGAGRVIHYFTRLVKATGLNEGLLTILPETVAAAHDAISQGVDKVIFTGSSENGRDVLSALSDANIPSTMELSGVDPVLVLQDADLDLVVRALDFGTKLNAGETCIKPRWLLVHDSVAENLRQQIAKAELPAMRTEHFSDNQAAVDCVNAADYGLGASIFTRDIAVGNKLGALLKTGFVTINDIIMPTADPRMPFGGVKHSGFGVTRGDEGLLEMTFPHVVVTRKTQNHPHFDPLDQTDAELFSAYIRTAHGGGSTRWTAARELMSALVKKVKNKKS